MKKTDSKKMEVSGTKPEVPASQDAKRRPLKSFALNGVSASVWARDHEVRGEARRFFSVTFERSYRDATGKTAYSRSMNPEDLGPMMSLCQQAGEFINEAQNLEPATAED